MDFYPRGKTQKTVATKKFRKKSTPAKPGCFCPATDLNLRFLRADVRGCARALPGEDGFHARRSARVRCAESIHALPRGAGHPSGARQDRRHAHTLPCLSKRDPRAGYKYKSRGRANRTCCNPTPRDGRTCRSSLRIRSRWQHQRRTQAAARHKPQVDRIRARG
jgi:hypothetical protein